MSQFTYPPKNFESELTIDINKNGSMEFQMGQMYVEREWFERTITKEQARKIWEALNEVFGEK
jgi:hypothetical protein